MSRPAGTARWTVESSAAALRAVIAELDAVPRQSAYVRYRWGRSDAPAVNTLVGLFGSWSAALAAAGLTEPYPSRTRRRWDDRGCIEALQRLTAELGAPPTQVGYADIRRERDDVPPLTALRERFGSWSAALAAAGLRPPRKRRATQWTAAACAQALRQVIAEVGEVPTQKAYATLAESRDDVPPLAVQWQRFGSWSGALEAAGARTPIAR